MGAVERITKRLRRHPELVYRVSGGMVTVEPPTTDGFPVSLTEGAGEWVVGFDGWHEHFTSEDEALDCFAFGLSDRCRLRVHRRGSFPYRWTVEERTGDGWRADSTTGRLSFPFWRRPWVEYRQNAVLRTGDPGPAADRAGAGGDDVSVQGRDQKGPPASKT
jgi:hypothetical protein